MSGGARVVEGLLPVYRCRRPRARGRSFGPIRWQTVHMDAEGGVTAVTLGARRVDKPARVRVPARVVAAAQACPPGSGGIVDCAGQAVAPWGG